MVARRRKATDPAITEGQTANPAIDENAQLWTRPTSGKTLPIVGHLSLTAGQKAEFTTATFYDANGVMGAAPENLLGFSATVLSGTVRMGPASVSNSVGAPRTTGQGIRESNGSRVAGYFAIETASAPAEILIACTQEG